MATKLSVNINKIATIRNARGGNKPYIMQFALDAEQFGAEGITVHPRPDERHIRYQDVYDLAPVLKTEFNIEGNPTPDFLDLVLKVKPAQCTLVPDSPEVLTSNAGWNTKKHLNFLKDVIQKLKDNGIRSSIFINADVEMINYAAETGTDRIELYTESYAAQFKDNKEKAIEPFVKAAEKAHELKLGINAGHDLDLDNLFYFSQNIPNLLEVSIGHALISDALYYGIQDTIELYKQKLK
jgi:pyridoxine 5-phosphate synthase